MPIYEFYCADCHTIFSFLSRSVETRRRPDCPRCGRAGLDRRPSAFAISKGRSEPEVAEGMPDLDESKLERAMESMAAEMDGVDEDDPRQAARLMRKLYEAAGVPVRGGIEEAIRRMESGEDPEAIEERMGDVLEEDPFAAPAPGSRLARLRRKVLPPALDTRLYDL